VPPRAQEFSYLKKKIRFKSISIIVSLSTPFLLHRYTTLSLGSADGLYLILKALAFSQSWALVKMV